MPPTLRPAPAPAPNAPIAAASGRTAAMNLFNRQYRQCDISWPFALKAQESPAERGRHGNRGGGGGARPQMVLAATAGMVAPRRHHIYGSPPALRPGPLGPLGWPVCPPHAPESVIIAMNVAPWHTQLPQLHFHRPPRRARAARARTGVTSVARGAGRAACGRGAALPAVGAERQNPEGSGGLTAGPAKSRGSRGNRVRAVNRVVRAVISVVRGQRGSFARSTGWLAVNGGRSCGQRGSSCGHSGGQLGGFAGPVAG
jgi:hypothetical protein